MSRAREAIREKARTNENNRRTAALISLYCQQGMPRLSIAGELNRAGFRTSRGKRFHTVQVQRIHRRLKDS